MADTMAPRTDRTVVLPEATPSERRALATIWGVLRLLMGWTFLWAFLDKTFALGFATGRDPETGAIDFFGDAAWINGGSPTEGALLFASRGHLGGFFRDTIGGCDVEALTCSASGWLDWVYMLSMLLIGLGLLLGIGVTLAVIGGVIWMAVFYGLTAVWPENNPFLDNHIIEAIVLIGIAVAHAGRTFGFGRWWEQRPIVQRHPILR